MTQDRNGTSGGEAITTIRSDRINKNSERETIVLEEKKPTKKPSEISSTSESQALFNQAAECMKRNRFKRAVELLKEALHMAPDNPYYLSYLGVAVANLEDDFETAVKLCKKAIVLLPAETELRINLGKVHRLSGDVRSAYSVFLDAWRRDPLHPAPAAELSRMGVRRPPVLPFLDRSHWLNKHLGLLRSKIAHLLGSIRRAASS